MKDKKSSNGKPTEQKAGGIAEGEFFSGKRQRILWERGWSNEREILGHLFINYRVYHLF